MAHTSDRQGKCSKISNMFFSICSPIKCSLSLFGAELTKKLVSIVNRGNPDRTASSEAVGSGSALFVWAVLAGD